MCSLSCRWWWWPCSAPAGRPDSWIFWTLWYVWESTSLQGMLQDPVSRGVGYPALFVCSTTAITVKTVENICCLPTHQRSHCQMLSCFDTKLSPLKLFFWLQCRTTCTLWCYCCMKKKIYYLIILFIYILKYLLYDLLKYFYFVVLLFTVFLE